MQRIFLTDKIKKSIALGLAAIIAAASVVTGCSSTAQAAEYWPENVSVTSGAAVVMDVDTGTVLYEKGADDQHYPASITKVMTALLALENCELDEIVTFSETAVYENEGDTSHIAREVGEEMTLENCLYGMMLESANECAWAIGEHVGGGDINTFVNMMNEKAKELGCTGTHFANPNGLHDADHYVTAHDMALIAQAAFEIPEFRKICGTRAYTIPADNKKEAYNCNNTHGMISNHRGSSNLYEYAIGGKTGYTDEAGNTLITFAEKNGMTLLCVILDSSNPAHYDDTESLFEYCFQNFTVYTVADEVDLSAMNEDASLGSLADKIDLIRVDENGTVILPTTASFSDASVSVSPATEGSDAVATMTYTYAGKQVGSADLLYEQTAEVSYPFHNIDASEGGSSIDYIRIDFKTIFLVALLLAAVALIAFVIHLQSGQILLQLHRRSQNKKKRNTKYRHIMRSKNHRRKRSSGMRTRTSAAAASGNERRSGTTIRRNHPRRKKTRQ